VCWSTRQYSLMKLLIVLCAFACVVAQVPKSLQGTWSGTVSYTWIQNGTIPKCCPMVAQYNSSFFGEVPATNGVGGVILHNTGVSMIYDSQDGSLGTAGPLVADSLANFAQCGTYGIALQVSLGSIQDLTGTAPNCYGATVTTIPDGLGFGSVDCNFLFDPVTGYFAVDLFYCAVFVKNFGAPILCPNSAGYPVQQNQCTFAIGEGGLALSEWITGNFTKISNSTSFGGSSTGNSGGTTSSAGDVTPALFMFVVAALSLVFKSL